MAATARVHRGNKLHSGGICHVMIGARATTARTPSREAGGGLPASGAEIRAIHREQHAIMRERNLARFGAPPPPPTAPARMLNDAESPEFQRPTLEALRQPLETGRAVVARANHHVTYPPEVQLIAAMNPCRCGHMDDAAQACGRAPVARVITNRKSPVRFLTVSIAMWRFRP